MQYATPLFAFNVAVLLSEGRGADLVAAVCVRWIAPR